MSIRHKLLIILLAMSLLFICSCSETEEYLLTPSPSPITTPAGPTPQPTVKPKATLEVISAEITSNNEDYSTPVRGSKLNCHAGYANIKLQMNGGIDEGIIEYIYINDELINPDNIRINSDNIRIELPESLPYFYTLQIKGGYEIADGKMTNSYTLDFLHEPALTYKMSYYNFQLQGDSPEAIYLTENNPSFLVEFSNPVVRDSLIFARSYFAFDPDLMWLSDTEVLITFNNLNNGRHTVGIQSVQGQADIYGNKLTPKSTYGENFSFIIRDRQNIYSAIPENNHIELITSLEYGSLFKSISSDSKSISLGIVTDDTDGFICTESFLDLNLKTLTTLNSFLSESISKALGITESIEYSSDSYSSLIRNSWNNEGKYIYYNSNRVFLINLITQESELFYSTNDKSRNIGQLIQLKSGNYAAINNPFNANDFLKLILLDSSGNILNEYQLPLKVFVLNGQRYFNSQMEEAEDGSIFISGIFLNNESELPFNDSQINPVSGFIFKTLKINPDNGEIEIDFENPRNIYFYPEVGYGISYGVNNDNSQITLDIIDLDGKLLKSHPINRPSTGSITFNPHKNVFYILDFDLYTQSSTISILDAKTLELRESGLSFNYFIEPIGITENGELLLMDLL